MPDALHVGSGKVRELYTVGEDHLLLVASDRISTFGGEGWLAIVCSMLLSA